eukprot:scaffold5612_cov108-Isochrysis_galbana.AAC.4
MEDRDRRAIGRAAEHSLAQASVRHVAEHNLHLGFELVKQEPLGPGDVDEEQLAHRCRVLGAAASTVRQQLAALEDRAGQHLAQEASASGDHTPHVGPDREIRAVN